MSNVIKQNQSEFANFDLRYRQTKAEILFLHNFPLLATLELTNQFSWHFLLNGGIQNANKTQLKKQKY